MKNGQLASVIHKKSETQRLIQPTRWLLALSFTLLVH